MSSTGDEPLTCPECGRVDDTGASFCPSCGMPLVRSGAEPLEAPLSDAHGRARKIDPPSPRASSCAWPAGATRPRRS